MPGPQRNIIRDEDGNEFEQRKISLDASTARPGRKKGPRVRVYNKLRAKLFTSDGFLEPESEGEILRSDLSIQGIADNVVKVQP